MSTLRFEDCTVLLGDSNGDAGCHRTIPNFRYQRLDSSSFFVFWEQAAYWTIFVCFFSLLVCGITAGVGVTIQIITFYTCATPITTLTHTAYHKFCQSCRVVMDICVVSLSLKFTDG